jgi:hypothetical protein
MGGLEGVDRLSISAKRRTAPNSAGESRRTFAGWWPRPPWETVISLQNRADGCWIPMTAGSGNIKVRRLDR